MSSTLLWFRCPLLMFTSRTSIQLNWEIIKQTHQTGCLLQWQSSRRKTLIKCVGSQTRWREATQACMCFNIWQEFSLGDERLGLAPTLFIFSKTTAIAQLLWWTNWMRVLTPIWRFCALTVNGFSTELCQMRNRFQNRLLQLSLPQVPESQLSERMTLLLCSLLKTGV